MTDLRCLMWMAGAALTMGLLAAASSVDTFQAQEVSTKFKGRSRVLLTVTYTASSRPYARCYSTHEGEQMSKGPWRHRFNEDTGEVIFSLPSRLQLSVNITFTFTESVFTLILHSLPAPPGRREPSVDRRERVPNISLQPGGRDIVYAVSGDGDASYNLSVLTEAPREEISEERLDYTAYVRNGSQYEVHVNYPLTVTKTAAQDNGAQYRLDFNIGQEPPAGVLIFKALFIYSGEDYQLVRGMEVEQRVDFYPQGSQDPVPDDASTFALVRDRDFSAHAGYRTWSLQLCDLTETPECQVSCSAVGSGTPQIQIRKTWGDFGALPDSETTNWMGFLTVTSAPVPNLSDGEIRFYCVAELDNVEQEQAILFKARERATIIRNVSSAVLEPNQKLYVKCRVRGLPVPEDTVTISEAGPSSNSSPLQTRFPNESFTRIVVIGRQVEVQYWLDLPSVTSNMTQVQCSATNGYGVPDVVVMDVVRQ